jgi:Tol biopolymer transport system component
MLATAEVGSDLRHRPPPTTDGLAMKTLSRPIHLSHLRPASAIVAALLLAGAAEAQVTERVSVGTGGPSGGGGYRPVISADGRFVAFESAVADLVAGDTNSSPDIFVRDRSTGITERVSVSSAGVEGNSWSQNPAISPDGRFVVFQSDSTNLVTGDTNLRTDIFLRDRLLGTTDRVSLASNGAQANNFSEYPSVSADGRYVAYSSEATNIGGGNLQWEDVFLHDRQTGQNLLVSVGMGGAAPDFKSLGALVSADGRYVAFTSVCSNLVAGDTNNGWDVFVRDMQTGTTQRVSVDSNGSQAGGDSSTVNGCLSSDARYVAFTSSAPNLVSGDGNAAEDVFLRDRTLGTTQRVSLSGTGVEGNGDSGLYGLGLSGDGRCVVFASAASNLVPGDTNGKTDIFVRDVQLGTTERVNVSSSGQQSTGTVPFHLGCAIDGTGRFAAFHSTGGDLASGDTNGWTDVFTRDRYASGFTSLCDPGQNGVVGCPCGNPPAGLGRGCDNSSASGGASLSASGIAYLSLDSLVFTTGAERPTAPSVLVQGDGLVPNGLMFGQGVRCAGGVLKRMYVKTAANGSITAPDHSAGDPTVSARSASLGAPLQAGVPYSYFVYYRDPVVLGGCPASSGFNATQTGQVVWWP